MHFEHYFRFKRFYEPIPGTTEYQFSMTKKPYAFWTLFQIQGVLWADTGYYGVSIQHDKETLCILNTISDSRDSTSRYRVLRSINLAWQRNLMHFEYYFRFKGFYEPPGSADEYSFSMAYWHILAAKLAFIVVFEVCLVWCYLRSRNILWVDRGIHSKNGSKIESCMKHMIHNFFLRFCVDVSINQKII